MNALGNFFQFDVIADILMALIWIGGAVTVGFRLLVGEPRNVNDLRHSDGYEVDRRF